MPAKNEAPNYNPQICDLDHTGAVPKAIVEALPMTERHPFRHRCAGCAYREGYEAGLNVVVEALPEEAHVTLLKNENAELRAQIATLAAKLDAAATTIAHPHLPISTK